MLPLTPEQQERYSRQTRLPQIGEEGQQRLLASRVLVIGVGGWARRYFSTSPPPVSATW